MSEADKRISDRISVLAASRSADKREYEVACNAIRAALADPIIRREIENSALERAAGVCDELISGDGICAADGVWIHDCAAAIRALKG
jgi:hypothetical protein